MRNARYYLLGATLGAVFCLTMTYGRAQTSDSTPAAAVAEPASVNLAPTGPQTGDPARWYVDDATAQAQLRTLRKEIGAALQEAQKECRQLAAPERAGCLNQARATYQSDLANAEAQRQKVHPAVAK